MPLERDPTRIVVPVAHREHGRLLTVFDRVHRVTNAHTVIRADDLATFYRMPAAEAFGHLFRHDPPHPVSYVYRDAETGSDRIPTGELTLIGTSQEIQDAIVSNKLMVTGALSDYLVPKEKDGVRARVTPVTDGSSTDVAARLTGKMYRAEAEYTSAVVHYA